MPSARQTFCPATNKAVKLALVPVRLAANKLVEVVLVPVALVQVTLVPAKFVEVTFVTTPFVAVSVVKLRTVPVALVKINWVDVAADKIAVPPSRVTFVAVKFNAFKFVEEELVNTASVANTPVDVTFPWRFTVNTGEFKSLIPRIKKSFWFEVPDERTSNVERVPVAAVFDV